jgi:UTP--glucose-1-phosphate uridylyltransferase|tara:strand:- start:191 stop:1069 length:879 start_codon:yes stop_codon:yes gene_type:complete
MRPVRKAILPVAGLGTRFLPATKSTPKEMLPIIDKPLVQYAVEEAIDIGITEIIFITSHSKISIEKHFEENTQLEESLKEKGQEQFIDLINPEKFKDIKFSYINQNDQKGLGHAISLAENLINEEDDAVAVLLPDDLFIASSKSCLQTLSDLYQETSSSVIAINKVAKEELSNYGVIDAKIASERVYELNGIVEKPDPEEAPSDLAVCGRYILTKSIFKSLKNIKRGAGGEYQLTDAIKDLIHSEKVIASLYEGKKFDCGSKKGFIEATIAMALSNIEIKEDILAFIDSIKN